MHTMLVRISSFSSWPISDTINSHCFPSPFFVFLSQKSVYVCVCARTCMCEHVHTCMHMSVCVAWWMWRSLDNGDIGPHLLPSLRQDLLMLASVNTKLPGLWASGNSPVSTPYLIIGALRLQGEHVISGLRDCPASCFWISETGSYYV